jgi:hypothetical protein
LSGWHIFSRGFWRAVVRPYASVTFARGMQEAGLTP